MTPLDLASLRRAYDAGALTPSALVEELRPRLEGPGTEGIWIRTVPAAALQSAARDLEARRRAGAVLPLYGVPFAVKDNIDVAGLPTTAACPALAYVPEATAPVVARLLEAGALLVGKTNMDQLATGLVGVRSPFGVPVNPFDPRYVVGGSSSGSAAAVARGLVSFALGTDTAGSGRVPASFTNTVGLKPTRGRLPTAGVVPACRSLDCVSVFALACGDAAAVVDLAGPAGEVPCAGTAAPARFRLGVLSEADLEVFGDAESARRYAAAREAAAGLGAVLSPVPFAPFREAGRLLYDGPWVAERLAPFEALLERDPGALLPVIREILGSARRYGGVDVFRALHRLEELRAQAAGILARCEALLLPTAPTIYTIAEVTADPLRLNARLGTYTNFVNLLDLAAIAVPAGFRADGLPFGVSLVGPRKSDPLLCAIGDRLHRALSPSAGATGRALPPPGSGTATGRGLRLAVVGAHLTGEPLNHQLVERGARLVRACRTAAAYRLYALAGTAPHRPGMVRVREGGGPLEIEIWELPREAVGDFLAGVPPPLCIGTVEAEDGERVAGFLCEPHALEGARDITALGGWRRFVHGS